MIFWIFFLSNFNFQLVWQKIHAKSYQHIKKMCCKEFFYCQLSFLSSSNNKNLISIRNHINFIVDRLYVFIDCTALIIKERRTVHCASVERSVNWLKNLFCPSIGCSYKKGAEHCGNMKRRSIIKHGCR